MITVLGVGLARFASSNSSSRYGYRGVSDEVYSRADHCLSIHRNSVCSSNCILFRWQRGAYWPDPAQKLNVLITFALA